MHEWDHTDSSQKPTLETIGVYVNNPLWEQLCEHLKEHYQSTHILEYSGCSMQPGWNVKYKKRGRALCTLYPTKGYYTALVVIGERERVETEFALPFFTEYIRELYHNSKVGMGQRWLMIAVTDHEILKDVIQCIALRNGSKKIR